MAKVIDLKQKVARLMTLLNYWQPATGCDQEKEEAYEAGNIAEEVYVFLTCLESTLTADVLTDTARDSEE